MNMFLVYGVALAIVVLAVVQVSRVIVGYRRATGTRWQRFLAAFSYSHTILLSRLATFIYAVAVWAVNFLPSLDPTSSLGLAITAAMKPEYSVWYGLGFALLVELVRKWPPSHMPILPPPQSVVIPDAPMLADK